MKHLNLISFGFVITFVLAGCLTAAAQGSGVFTGTGSLITARYQHTATLLASGKTLVVGGLHDDYDLLASAELYDPVTGVWTPTGSLITARYQHTATLLANGKVLVVGGYDTNGDALASAELYDPSTGVWSHTGSLGTARFGNTATLLPNGKVLVAGGDADELFDGFPDSFPVSSAELYDPSTGHWTATGSLAVPRSGHTATLLANGQALVTGGAGESYAIWASAELYNPATGVWTPTGSMANPRSGHTATLLADGQVLVAGGNGPGEGNVIATAELYDPATGAWSPTGSLITELSGFTATLLNNGQVLAAAVGGDASELYDPATGAWYPVGSLPQGFSGQTATLLPNGQVLLTSGNVSELYEPGMSTAAQSADVFTPTGSLTSVRLDQTATLLPNGQVLVAGGISGGVDIYYLGGDLASAELYNPATGAWTPTGDLGNARTSHTATLLPNGQVLVAGGLGGVDVYDNGVVTSGGDLALSSAELYDPATGVWTPTGSLATARQQHTATLLASGKALVVGGYDTNGGILSSAELYDPATGIWRPTGRLTTARSSHKATLLSNGKVLVIGGDPSGSGAELYDPATGAWTPTGSLHTARYNFTATLLADGDALVVGGELEGTNVDLSSAELYDPATGDWTPTGSLGSARAFHTATLLPNGKVLVAGGYDDLNSTELYDPATGVWSPGGYLYYGRSRHTATLLADGQALIAGGLGLNGQYNGVSSAELYNPGTSFLNPILKPVKLGDGSLQVGFSFASGPSYTVRASSNVAAPINTWSNLGTATEITPGSGQFQFADHSAPNCRQRFYRLGMATTIQNTNDFFSAGSMANARIYHTATLLANGMVLVAGGYVTDDILSGSELYDPATGLWTRISNLGVGRAYHTATLLANGMVLVAGGVDTNGDVTASAELYNPATGLWRPTGNLGIARAAQTATLLANGTVLVAGGGDNYRNSINTAELYDPATGLWTPTGSLNAVRYESTATLLANGKVLVAGGDGEVNGVGVSLASAELYDPATGVWTLTGSLAAGRDNHTATLLPNGQVLVAGGEQDESEFEDPANLLASAELYDPATGIWTPTSSLGIERTFHTATLLANGKVLVAGGQCGAGYPSLAELYDPATGAWSPTGSLATGRVYHTATLLPSGNVLIAGGLEDDFDLDENRITLASAELYDPSL